MRVCVVGCGAVGSLFAANLAAHGEVEVWAYDLDHAHVDAINADGLRLFGEREVHGRPHATSDPSEIPPSNFGIVATKSMHTGSAIEAVAHVFHDGSVCSVQNGVGNEELIAEHVPSVIRGTTFPAGRVVEPGRVSWDTTGDTWLGPFEPAPAPMQQVRALAAALTAAGMPTQALEDARGAQWTKLIFNAATNPLGAITGLTHGQICDESYLRELVSGLVREGVEVAEAQGITLDSDPDELVDHAARVAYHHRASMLQDAEAERRTEIDFLNGGICTFGRQAGVETPLNAAVWALVLGLERSWSREASRA